MRIVRHLLLAISLLLAGFAQADVYTDCQDAIASENRTAVINLSATILRFTNVTIGKKRRIGLECINYAMGEEYVYDEHSASFMTKTLAEKLVVEREQASKKIEERQRREEQILAELEAADESLQMQARERDVNRKMTVWRRVLVACNRLYKTHPDETVTNRICLDLFLETGLPNN